MGGDLSDGAKIGIVLIVLCFIIAIVLGLLMVVKNITNSGAGQMEAGLDQMLSTTYDDYDQKVVSGTKVISAMKLFQNEPTAIVVVSGKCQETGGPKGGYCYGYLLKDYVKSGNGDTEAYKKTAPLTKNTGESFYTAEPVDPSAAQKYCLNTKPVAKSGTEQFVRENGKFLAELIKDSTGTIVGIAFTQQVA